MTRMCSATRASPARCRSRCRAGPRPSPGRSARTPWCAPGGRCPGPASSTVPPPVRCPTGPTPTAIPSPRRRSGRRSPQVDHDPLEAPLVHADPPGLDGGVDLHLGGAPLGRGRPCARTRPPPSAAPARRRCTSSRKTSTEPASARDISSRSPTMRWKRRRSSLSSCRARCERGRQLVPVGLEHLDGGGQRGEGGAQLVAHVGVEAGLALDALLELVDHGVEGDGEALEVGVGRLGVEPGVELAAGDGARRPRHDGQRPQRARAGEAAERDAQHGGDDAGHEQGQREHAQRVVEVGQVEHLEVVGLHGGDRDADHDLGRALRGAVGLGGRRAVEDHLAQLVGDGRRRSRRARSRRSWSGGRAPSGRRSPRRCCSAAPRTSCCPTRARCGPALALVKAWCWAADSRPASRKWRTVK